MELHDALAALARDHGTALFTDASAFRGALDDYLDEGTASTGTINLLTDAVRLGALDGMLNMLDSGADAESAVDTAGRRLSRDRGSADVTGSQWACAVLGYALGKVPVEMATRLRPDARTAEAGPGSSTAPRPAPPAPSPQSAPAPPQPAPTPGSTPYAGWSGGAGPQQPAWGAPQQPRKSRTGLIIGLAVVAVVLIIGTVIGIVALAGDDEDPSAGGSSSEPTGDTGSSTTEPTSDPTTLTTGTPDSLGGPTIAGDGYAFGAPEDWTDGTDALVAQDTVGTIDSAAVWGDTLAQSRASVLVETSSAYGESDPQELKDTWVSNVVNGITPVTSDGVAPQPIDLEPTDLGGAETLGIELLWTNQNGIEVRQLAFLTINGDTLYSVTASFKQSDEGVEPVVYEILGTWAWQ